MLSSPFLHICLFFPPSAFVKQTKSLDSQVNSTSRTFVLKHFINLAADGLGALACPICWCLWNKICVKYIWFDWGVFTCFPNSPYGLWVQTNIVSKCASLFVYMLPCMCVLPDDAWLTWNTLLQFAVECRAQRWRGEVQRRMRNRDERIKRKTTADSKVWDSGGVPTVRCGLLHIRQTHLTYLMTTFSPDVSTGLTGSYPKTDWLSLLHLFWFCGF